MAMELTSEDVESNRNLFDDNGPLLIYSLYWVSIALLQIDLFCVIYVIYRTIKKWNSSNNNLSMAYKIPFHIACIEFFIYVFQTINLIHPAIFVENWTEPICSVLAGGFFFMAIANILMVGIIALMSWLIVCIGIKQPDYGMLDYKLFIIPIGSAIVSTAIAGPTFGSDEFWCYTPDEFTTIPKFLLVIDFSILFLSLFCYVSIIMKISSTEFNNTNRPFLFASRKIIGYLTMYIIQWTPLMFYLVADFLNQEHASVYFIAINFIASGGILNMIQYVINEGWVNDKQIGSSLTSSTELTINNDNALVRIRMPDNDDGASSINNKDTVA